RRVRRHGLARQDAGEDEMADDDECDIGRRIVGAVVIKLLAAGLATIDDLQIGAEDLAFAAVRAAAVQAPAHRAPDRAYCLNVQRQVGQWQVGHRRFFFSLAARSPRDSISNLSAPANGAASTSFTSTLAPSRYVSPVRVPVSARAASS